MRFSQLGVAALSGVGHSFLIPSTISATSAAEKVTADYTLPFSVKALTSERIIDVNCPGCPVQTLEKGAMNLLHVESVLRLNFTIAHEEQDKLMLNGLQIYPIETSVGLMSDLKADQLIRSPDNTWTYASSPVLGYNLGLSHALDRATETKNGLSLVSVHVQIIEVGSTFIRRIPAINLSLVETPTKQLMLGPRINGNFPIATAVAHAQPYGSISRCRTFLCKWKAIVAAKAARLRKGGCAGQPARPKIHSMPRPHGLQGGPNKFTHHRPHGTFSHGSHRRPHHSPLVRFLKSVTFHIIFPLIIGVFIGMTAGLIGVVVGHMAIFFWRLFFRRGERAQYCRVQQEAASEDKDDETKGFLDNQGPPPVYEDNVVVDEKTEQK